MPVPVSTGLRSTVSSMGRVTLVAWQARRLEIPSGHSAYAREEEVLAPLARGGTGHGGEAFCTCPGAQLPPHCQWSDALLQVAELSGGSAGAEGLASQGPQASGLNGSAF